MRRYPYVIDEVAQAAFWRRRFAWLVLVMIMVAWPAAPGHTQERIYSAVRVKAAFLYHFSTYVQWPDDAASNDVFTIAVLGADPVARELERFLPGHTIQGRPMEVHRLRSIGGLNDAEVLYIGADENRHLSDHLETLRSRPLLVVTDVPEGLREGAMINFRIVDERVRFEISLSAAQNAGLEVSSRLLSAAMSVDAAGAIINVPATVVAIDRAYTAPD